MNSKWMYLITAAALVAAFASTGIVAADDDRGAVYTLTNSAAGNAVAIFSRADDGRLTPSGSVSTGGLGSQGALTLSADRRWLFAVNAGSNDVSVFAVSSGGLKLASREASGGSDPISVASYKDLVYVLNTGGSGNIAGFRLGEHGQLIPISHSTRNLSNNGLGAAPGPAEISFSSTGDALAVTEKNTNLIDTFPIDRNGRPGAITTHASAGATPFGFAFARHGALIVSEAAGGAPNASSASSYRVSEHGFALISAAVPTEQTAACWLVTTDNGRFAYTANAGSGSLSLYAVGGDDALTLLKSVAGFTGATSHPSDMALSQGHQFLYVLANNTQSIDVFAVLGDGSLTPLGGNGGLPASAVGLAAR